MVLPSSSNITNRVLRDAAVTISPVEASYVTLLYGLPRGTARDGIAVSKQTSGSHSIRHGPYINVHKLLSVDMLMITHLVGI